MGRRQEDTAIVSDIQNTISLDFKDPEKIKQYLLRIANRQDQVIEAFRYFRKRIIDVEEVIMKLGIKLDQLRTAVEAEENNDDDKSNEMQGK